MAVTDRQAVDQTSLHRVWKAILIGYAIIAIAACLLVPILSTAVGLFLLLILCGRAFYTGRNLYIHNFHSRDITVYG